MSVTEADHWKSHCGEEDLDCPLRFMKYRVPAPHLQGIGTDYNTVGEKHISTPLTTHRGSGGAQRTGEEMGEPLGISHICSLRMSQETATLERNSVPSEVTSSHSLDRRISSMAGRQWRSKRRPAQRSRIKLSPKHMPNTWGVGGPGQGR